MPTLLRYVLGTAAILLFIIVLVVIIAVLIVAVLMETVFLWIRRQLMPKVDSDQQQE